MKCVDLTEDQRWLLFVAAPGRMEIVLIDPDYGIPLLKEGRSSGAWPAGRKLIPEWLCSYRVTQSGIEGGQPGQPPHAKVTWSQLSRFAYELPVHLRAVLMNARKADRNNCKDALLTVLGLAEGAPRQLDLFAGTS